METKDQSDSRIGLVLGGGAALGLAHIGVIRALEEENIKVDVVVGCSMGALVAGLWATGHKANDMKKIAKEFSSKTGGLKIFDPPIGRSLVLLGMAILFWALGHSVLACLCVVLLALVGLVPVSGIVNGRAIKRWLKNKFGRSAFAETKIPLRMVGYDLLHRREIILSEGPIAEAVFKSIALPGIIPPVMEEGQMIVDGGVLNPLPVSVLRDMGVKRIIAVNVLKSPEEVCRAEEESAKRLRKLQKVSLFRQPRKFMTFRPGHLAAKLFSPNIADVIVQGLQVSQYVLAEASGREADVLITPDLSGVQWFELYKVNTLIQRGYDAAKKNLPAIKALMKK